MITQNPSQLFGIHLDPQLFFYFDYMSRRYDFISHLAIKYILTSS